ncbi:MAG: c-type cytochrome [Alphaproteobacteria bacterium]|nr:c-type cytochrome [Alphaproteobacteria bacterium]NNF71790.1 c-type cytochrome [Paracoccaceae bacterium]
MFDTMTVTKAVGSICAAFLVLLLGKWAAEGLYHVGGHGKHAEQAYSIDTGEEDHGAEDVVEEVDFGPIFASASAEDGENLWRACRSCHALEAGKNGTGPYLTGVVGRAKGAAQGYAYSEAMASQEGEWTPENLQLFLENPREYTPGTKMAYNGMRDIEDRANLIAYLATFN